MMTEKKADSNLYGLPSNRCFTDDQATEADTFSVYGHYEVLSARKPVPVIDKYEGRPCLHEEGCVDESAKPDLPWQFGPGNPLDVESQYITVEKPLISDLGDSAVLNDSKKSIELDLEWQWIMDQQQTYQTEWFTSSKFEDTGTKDDPTVTSDKDDVLRVETDTSPASSLFSGSKTEGSFDAGTSKSSKLSGNLSVELNATKSSQRDGAVWHTADSKELAALVSRRGHGYLENCDLPSSQSPLTWKGRLASDLTPSKDMKCGALPAENVFLASLPRRHVPTDSKNRSLPSSPLIIKSSGSTQSLEHLPRVSQPQPIPSTLPRTSALKSSEDQPMTWGTLSGKHAGVGKRDFEALGEALCHSQTRARQAEKLAAQALQEREKLACLLFRESWTARTYKQWVQTLEFENMWLRMCSGSDIEVWMGNEPSDASAYMVSNPLKPVGKRHSRKKIHHCLPSSWEGRQQKHRSGSENSVWFRCTIGLAFALGLSFAGAGLMIGWSMGWILLSY